MKWFSFQLFFTIVIWVFFSVILLSNRHNRLNRWCFFTGMLFSLGVFKEYFYYDLAPAIAESCFVESIYSCMTSILYLCAMPAALLFSLYFCGYAERQPVKFRRILILIPIPMLIFASCFSPFETHTFQQTSMAFWISASIYNLFYGALFTVLLFRGVKREPSVEIRRQKRLVTVIVIPLIWYWLITIFVIHTLKLNLFFKAWQGNVILLVAAMCFYIGMAFREGIMGIRLNSEHYQWELETQIAFRGAQFISHAMNRELTKIDWCAANLAQHYSPKPPTELRIISQSADRLRNLAARTCLYSGELLTRIEACAVSELLRDCDLASYAAKGIKIVVSCDTDASIHCDIRHTTEILRNLLDNAADAVEQANGILTITLESNMKARRHKGRYDILAVSDNGHGIPPEQIQTLFKPYLTYKTGDEHLGLGLFYCMRAMHSHGGFIEIKSSVGKGSSFRLHFPSGGQKR